MISMFIFSLFSFSLFSYPKMSATEVNEVMESMENITLWADRQTCKNYYFDYEEPVYKWATGPTNYNNHVSCEKTPIAVRPKFKKGDDKRPPCIVTCPNGKIVHYQDFEDFFYINPQQTKRTVSNPLEQFVTGIRRL